jgi:hypothetical protein
MPKFYDPEKEQAWLRHRAQREHICRLLFGHSVRTMIGVVLIALGGVCAGMAIVVAARDGWTYETIAGGFTFAVLGIGFGLSFIPQRDDRD